MSGPLMELENANAEMDLLETDASSMTPALQHLA